MKIKLLLLSFFLTLSFSNAVVSPGSGNTQQSNNGLEVAKQLVEKAIEHTKKTPIEQALKDFNLGGSPEWLQGNLYITVLADATKIKTAKPGDVVAHAAKKFAGLNQIDLKDINNLAFVKKVYEDSINKGEATVEYKWSDPVKKKIVDKLLYCKKIDAGYIICGSNVK